MGWARNSYAGNETAPYQAAVNCSMSTMIFGEIPTHQIDSNIIWLEIQRNSIEQQISELNRIKKERARTKAWRQNLNKLAKQFMDDDFLDRPDDKIIDIVIQQIGCEYAQAAAIAKIVKSWAERRKTELKHEKIVHGWRMGKTVIQLHKEHSLSRQQIYNIIHKYENNLICKT